MNSRRHIDLILFDLDGTLVDSQIDVTNAINHALSSLGLATIAPDRLFATVWDGIQKTFEKLLGPMDDVTCTRAVDLYREYYADHLLDNTRPYPGVPEMLEKLSGKTMAVVSNKREIPVLHILEGAGIAIYFDMVVGGDSLPAHKPDPLPILHVLNRYRMPPDRALIVGDSPHDMAAGRAAGIGTCAVTYGYHPISQLIETGPEWTIHSIEELPNLIL
jgi:phosphoglycolate phosphatase